MDTDKTILSVAIILVILGSIFFVIEELSRAGEITFSSPICFFHTANWDSS